MTRESFEWRMAVSDRGYSWAGAEEGRKSFYVWGSPIKALSRQMKFKLALQHAIQRREYFDSFVFDDAHRAACCHAINRFRPPALVGYAGNLVELALYARAHPEALRWKARSLVTAAEGLQPGQRQLLEATLADEVFMSYGSREFMLIGMECPEHRGYHLSADTLLVEVVDDCGQPLPPGKAGRIVVTDLRNAANPFIRYEIGDLGTMAAEPCPCGLPFPLLQSVEGRIQEFLLASDGSRQTALFIPHLMKEFRWVRGYQLVQADPTHVRVNVVTETALVPAAVEPIVQALKGKLGQAVNVSVESVPALRKSATGKVPIVIQESPASTG
jgi:phenylacetate-CoA ligase